MFETYHTYRWPWDKFVYLVCRCPQMSSYLRPRSTSVFHDTFSLQHQLHAANCKLMETNEKKHKINYRFPQYYIKFLNKNISFFILFYLSRRRGGIIKYELRRQMSFWLRMVQGDLMDNVHSIQLISDHYSIRSIIILTICYSSCSSHCRVWVPTRFVWKINCRRHTTTEDRIYFFLFFRKIFVRNIKMRWGISFWTEKSGYGAYS